MEGVVRQTAPPSPAGRCWAPTGSCPNRGGALFRAPRPAPVTMAPEGRDTRLTTDLAWGVGRAAPVIAVLWPGKMTVMIIRPQNDRVNDDSHYMWDADVKKGNQMIGVGINLEIDFTIFLRSLLYDPQLVSEKMTFS